MSASTDPHLFVTLDHDTITGLGDHDQRLITMTGIRTWLTSHRRGCHRAGGLRAGGCTRIMKLDAGIADCADGDGEGEPLQQREVNMDVEPLRLEAGEAISDGQDPLAHGIEMIQSLPEMEIGEVV